MTTKNSKSSKPSNFIVMTVAPIGDGGKVSDTLTSTGKAYATARGYNYTGKRKEEQTNPSMFFDVKAYSFDDTISKLVQQVADLSKGDKVTVKGRFGFRQWVSQSGIEKEALEIIASSVEEYDSKDKEARPSNFVMLTLKAHMKEEDEGNLVSYTESGKPMAKVRAHLSMGKDGNGNYRPSFWVNVLHVSKDDTMDPTIEAIGALKKGDYFTVKGTLVREEWTGKDADGNDVQRHGYTIWANSVEPFSWDTAETQETVTEEYLEGEPA
jgi:single-stranded DNA-binding protein